GLFLSMVGQDVITGQARFTLGIPQLSDGFGVVVVAMGIFGLGEVFANLETLAARKVATAPVNSLMPSREDWRRSVGPMIRGSGIGFLIGLLPGGGATLASFISYAVEKKVSKHPEAFGDGA